MRIPGVSDRRDTHHGVDARRFAEADVPGGGAGTHGPYPRLRVRASAGVAMERTTSQGHRDRPDPADAGPEDVCQTGHSNARMGRHWDRSVATWSVQVKRQVWWDVFRVGVVLLVMFLAFGTLLGSCMLAFRTISGLGQ